MKIWQNSGCWIFSSIAHFIILILILFDFTFTKQEVKLGKIETMLSSYIYQLKENHPISPSKPMRNSPSLSKDALIHQKKNPARAKNTDKPFKVKQMSTPEKPEEAGDEKPTLELVALLHASIQEHQKYPENALQMEREGKTTLVFTLYPDGTITSLKMVKSSGTHTLDEAALMAVNEAVPFKGIHQYLKNPEEFQITVAFELT